MWSYNNIRHNGEGRLVQMCIHITIFGYSDTILAFLDTQCHHADFTWTNGSFIKLSKVKSRESFVSDSKDLSRGLKHN